MKLWHRCFPVNFAKFLRTPFYRTPLGDCSDECNNQNIYYKSICLNTGSYLLDNIQYSNYKEINLPIVYQYNKPQMTFWKNYNCLKTLRSWLSSSFFSPPLSRNYGELEAKNILTTFGQLKQFSEEVAAKWISPETSR